MTRCPTDPEPFEQAAALIRSRFRWGNAKELYETSGAVREFRHSYLPRFQAAAAFGIGMAEFFVGRFDNAGIELDQAIQLATDSGQWLVLVNSLGIRAQADLAQNRIPEAEALGWQLLETAREHSLADLPHIGYHQSTLGAAVAGAGRLGQGDELLRGGIRQLGTFDPLLGAHARLMHATVPRPFGNLESARHLLDEANALMAQCGNAVTLEYSRKSRPN